MIGRRDPSRGWGMVCRPWPAGRACPVLPLEQGWESCPALRRPAGLHDGGDRMSRMVGWTGSYTVNGRQQRVSPRRSLYPFPILGPRRPSTNSFRPMGRVPRRRRGK
jgi:hypothetical protein